MLHFSRDKAFRASMLAMEVPLELKGFFGSFVVVVVIILVQA